MVSKVEESIDKVIDLKIQDVEEERNEGERRAVIIYLTRPRKVSVDSGYIQIGCVAIFSLRIIASKVTHA